MATAYIALGSNLATAVGVFYLELSPFGTTCYRITASSSGQAGLAALTAASVRSVISTTRNPPATSARASGTAAAASSMVMTGITGANANTSDNRAARDRARY